VKDEWEVEFSNGAKVRCCGEHLWTVYKTGARSQTITTEALSRKPHIARWHVPLVHPVSYTPSGNPLPIDPYLTGALIGDGGITAYVGFTSADPEIVAEVKARVPAGHELRHKGGYDYQIVSPAGQPNHVWNALRFLNLAGKKSYDKEIPAEYMTASPLERLLLLQGLMDTDGWSQGGRTCLFASSSRKLTEQVAEIVGSLGGVANPIRTKQTKCRDSYVLSFSLAAGMAPFRLPRKLSRVSKGYGSTLAVASARRTGRSVEMQCIAVASQDHLYVTAGFVLTHNTFVALDLAYAVAAGTPWMGCNVYPGPVLYLPYEGRGGMINRAKALRQRYGGDAPALYFGQANFNIREKAGRQALGALIAQLPAKPVLIVFDTFAKALMGDENSAKDVGDFNSAIEALIESTKACVLIVHHSGKDKAKGARGSSALLGAIDTEIEIDGGRVVSRKQRDLEIGEAIGFKLVPLVVAQDQDGDDVTSCVVDAHAVSTQGLARLSGNARRCFDKLCELRPDNTGITAREWQDGCVEFLGSKGVAQRFYDIKRQLAAKGYVIVEDDLIKRRME
jgi:hypothetical protein